jgi:hypothetical protein
MRIRQSVLAATAMFLTLVQTVPMAAAADLSGPWRLEFQGESTTAVYQADCVWEQEGPRLTGSCTSGFESIVTVRGRNDESGVTFQFTSGVDSGTVMTFSGRLNERETVIEGRWQFKDAQGQSGGGSFTAMKR